MSSAGPSKKAAVTVAARIAGQAATIGAHGVPVGPLADEVVRELLGALLDVQDEELAALRNIEQSVNQIGQDVAQLIEGPYRTAREMVERAKIPGRNPDAAKSDLQAASAEFLRAAGQHRDATLPRASAYMEASFVLGLLGDVQAMRYYSDKAWKEGIAALEREAKNASNALRRPTEKPRRGQRSFWSCLGDPRVALLASGEGGVDLAEIFPEARAIQHIHEIRRQADVYRGAAANLSDGPDVHPYHVAYAHLVGGRESAVIAVWKVYHRQQLESRRDEFAALLRKVGINVHLWGDLIWPGNQTWVHSIKFESLSKTDPQVVAFEAEVEHMFPHGICVGERSGWGVDNWFQLV